MVVRNVTVVGGGLMGTEIAQTIAIREYDVVVLEVSEQAARLAQKKNEKQLNRLARQFFKNDPNTQTAFVRKAISHLSYSSELSEGVKNADLVIEAITENLESKQALFAEIERHAPSHAILVSNTSSLLIGEIAKLTKRKTHVGGLHFLSPVPVSSLVEIIPCTETSDDTLEAIKQFSISLGKVYIVCKDTTGFILNCFLSTIIFSAARMVENGLADVADVDKAARLALGHPYGPLQLADYIGLDLLDRINQNFHEAQPFNPVYMPGLFARKVAEGKLGIKSGEGFYKYSGVNKSKL